MTRRMGRLFAALGGVIALLVAAVVAVRWYAGTAEPPSGDARLPGLTAPVEVWRDSLGVPHLWAANDVDLARAIGYLHAQDRLWQMELFRRVADGRLAEMLGADAREADRFLRTLGMGRVAADDERLLDGGGRAILEAYAAGVNHWITNRSGALPPEFLVLRHTPEPWTPRHSLAIAKVMAWDLADWNVGLDLQRAVDRVGEDHAAALAPGYPDWGPRIVPDGGDAPSPAPLSLSPAPGGVPELPAIPALAVEMLATVSAARASNSWVVAGSRTRSGKPILANDPHLELRAPSLWYLAALHGDRMDVAGVTIPGIPVVILGRTPGVAWGFTNAMADDVDFFVERLDEAGTRYLTPTGWQPVEVAAETIRVRGAEPELLRVRRTRHGPIVSDVDRRGGDRVIAMQWASLRPSPAFGAMLAMNRAGSAVELDAALRRFDSPHQNVVFADRDGTIGYRLAGSIPVRRGGNGLLPRPGWTGEADWTGWIPFDSLPHRVDPPEGYIVSANNAQAGPGYPYRIGSNYAEPFRAARIVELVRGARDLTAAEVAQQQMDVVDLRARRYLPHAVSAARAAGDSATAALLQRWDGAARRDSRAATVFYLWWEALRRRVGDDEFGEAPVFFPRWALDRILDAGGSPWVDDVGTPAVETLPELAAAAMRESVTEARGRPWGELHATRMSHALGAVPVLDRALEFNVGPFASAGSPATVNVAPYGRTAPFLNTAGASMRHVSDLGDPDEAGLFILPTGQSGLPFSRHYRDQTERWRAGRLWPVPLDRKSAERRAIRRTRLEP